MMNRYLIISTTGMGDCLWGTPAIRALKKSFPDVSIDLMVHARWKELLEGNPNVDRILEYYPQWYRQFFLGIKLLRQRYRAVLIFHANTNIMRLLPLIPTGRVLAQQPSNWLSKQWIVDVQGEVHGIPKRLAMIEALGGQSDGGQMEIFFKEQDQFLNQEFMHKNNLSPQNFIYLNIGASLAEKRWPAERFIHLAQKILENTSFNIVLGGGPEDKALAESIKTDLTPDRTTPVCDRKLRDNAFLISQARLLITGDTGPMHIGFAVGTSSILLFGPTKTENSGPYQIEEKLCAIVRPSNVMGAKDEIRGNQEMKNISVERVWKLVEEKLNL
jgi:ADP-heptose:LPS heptosyltransferase